jgi:hypothetical protein
MSFVKRVGFNRPPAAEKRRKKIQLNSTPSQFPSDLGGHQMIFQFFTYEGYTATTTKGQAAGKGEPVANIALPIPNNLTENYNVQYNTTALGTLLGEVTQNAGLLGDTLEEGTQNLQKMIDVGKSSFQNGKFNLDSFSEKFRMENEKIDNLIGQVNNNLNTAGRLALRNIASIVPGAGGAIDLLMGNTLNPHLATLLDNVPLRTHTFTWKFAPRSDTESKTLFNVTDEFRRRMHPSFGKDGGDALLSYPDEVEVAIIGTQTDMLPIKRSVITGFSINHTPDGTPAFHRSTGAPVAVECTLQLQETEIITSEDFIGYTLDYSTGGGSEAGEFYP